MTYIGIDPGKKGAMAVIDSAGGVKVIPYDPEQYRVALLKIDESRCRCALEKVGAMPGQGVTSMFSFGENYGIIQGLLIANRIPYQLVPPVKWKREYSLTALKERSVLVASRLFPAVSLKRTERSRTDDDGLAEALLLAEYARRHMGGAE